MAAANLPTSAFLQHQQLIYCSAPSLSPSVHGWLIRPARPSKLAAWPVSANSYRGPIFRLAAKSRGVLTRTKAPAPKSAEPAVVALGSFCQTAPQKCVLLFNNYSMCVWPKPEPPGNPPQGIYS